MTQASREEEGFLQTDRERQVKEAFRIRTLSTHTGSLAGMKVGELCSGLSPPTRCRTSVISVSLYPLLPVIEPYFLLENH